MANSIQYKLYLPPGFLDKRINEQVIFDFVDQVRHYSVWRRGDPLQKEPDFVCDGEGLEVTFASSDYSTRNFIGDFCDGVYSPLGGPGGPYPIHPKRPGAQSKENLCHSPHLPCHPLYAGAVLLDRRFLSKTRPYRAKKAFSGQNRPELPGRQPLLSYLFDPSRPHGRLVCPGRNIKPNPAGQGSLPRRSPLF